MPEPKKPYDWQDYLGDICTTTLAAVFSFIFVALAGLMMLDATTTGPIPEDHATGMLFLAGLAPALIFWFVGGEADDKWKADAPRRRLYARAEEAHRRRREIISQVVRDVEDYARSRRRS